jgi:hypothetical protein
LVCTIRQTKEGQASLDVLGIIYTSPQNDEVTQIERGKTGEKKLLLLCSLK